MKRVTPFLLILISLMYSSNSNSQERVVFGSVTTFEIIPIIQAEIYVKSSKQTVYSDSLGNFTVICEEKDKIKISADGFYSQNIKVNNNSDTILIDLKIRQQDSELAISSGHVKDGAQLESTMQLNDKKNDFSSYNSMYEVLDNKFPNVQLVDGDFGELHIIIGSPSSIAGSNYALVVIDGVISNSTNLGAVSPQDVKNIEILKPGAESSMYGSEGGNGVVKVTTKRGGDFN